MIAFILSYNILTVRDILYKINGIKQQAKSTNMGFTDSCATISNKN
jgi:hypothetical protein